MSLYHQTNQSITTESNLCTLLRDFLTDASIGWVESSHTTGETDEILVKTPTTHQGDPGIMHLLIKDGTPNYLEIHAYPPGYDAFDSPDSFDAPDTAYLPHPDGVGGSYVEADEYYNSTGSIEHRIDFTYTVIVDLYGDNNTFIMWVSNGATTVWLCGVLLTERELGFGWCQFVHGSAQRMAIKNGANIRKTNVYNKWAGFGQGNSNWGTFNGGFSDTLDTAVDGWVSESRIFIDDTSYVEVVKIPHLYNCNDNAGKGIELTQSTNTYLVIVPGSETAHTNGVAVLKGTEIT